MRNSILAEISKIWVDLYKVLFNYVLRLGTKTDSIFLWVVFNSSLFSMQGSKLFEVIWIHSHVFLKLFLAMDYWFTGDLSSCNFFKFILLCLSEPFTEVQLFKHIVSKGFIILSFLLSLCTSILTFLLAISLSTFVA